MEPDPGAALQALIDRNTVIDAVTAYAMALDARDWARFQSLFEEEVEIDYSALGGTHAVLTAAGWTGRCRVLGGFDATHHKVSNFVVALEGDRAMVTAYVDAAHFITRKGRVLAAFACGTYRHHLTRRGEGWRIWRCVFTLTGHPGGRAAFDEAFALARGVSAALENPDPRALR